MNSFDDYNDIYEQYANSGFKFDYNNRRLSRSKVIFEEELKLVPMTKRNDDDVPLLVNCKPCGIYMDFVNGHWVCPKCKLKVREMTIYNQLERENEKYLRSIEMDMPECCVSCGGPYPDCTSSCQLFDE